MRRWQRELDMHDDDNTDDGIAAENEIDERASIAGDDAEADEWESWLDDEENDE